MASALDPSTMRDSSGPSPPTALAASSTTVRRSSWGIAWRARFVASSRLPMSGGIRTLPTGISSPSCSFEALLGTAPGFGVSSTNCSPTAERLCTAAVTSAGIGVSLLRVSLASTPFLVTSMELTLPISSPR
jgi:hypothetical protein